MNWRYSSLFQISPLLFLKRKAICNHSLIFYVYFSFIIGITCKWRINVDEIDFPAVLFQHMTHNLKIISPKNLINPTVLLATICLLKLRRIILCGTVRTLARPAKFRKALDSRSLSKFKSKLLIHCGYPPFYRFLHHIHISWLSLLFRQL